MFQAVQRLGRELDDLTAKATQVGDPELAREVAKFVTDVATQAELAFTDVHGILRQVAFVQSSELSPEKIKALQDDLSATHAREKFKNALHICERLSVLADQYRDKIEPRLPDAAAGHTELFWLLEKHEGAFIFTIQRSVRQIAEFLDQYSVSGDVASARHEARTALTELETGLQEISRARSRVVGALPGGTAMLLDPRRLADDILRRSPWFSGLFYLAAALLLLTGLTVVAGSVSPYMFPLVVAGTFAGLTIIGALQLKNDGRLSEKSFVQLIDLSMRRVLLPLTRRSGTPDAG